MDLSWCSYSLDGSFQRSDPVVPSITSLCPSLATCQLQYRIVPSLDGTSPRPYHMVLSCPVLSCPRRSTITLLCACRSESSSSAVQMVLSSFSPFLLAWQSFSVVPFPLAHPFSRYLLNPFWLPSNVLTSQDREMESGSLSSGDRP